MHCGILARVFPFLLLQTFVFHAVFCTDAVTDRRLFNKKYMHGVSERAFIKRVASAHLLSTDYSTVKTGAYRSRWTDPLGPGTVLSEDVGVKREWMLKALIVLLGEDVTNLFKEYNEDDIPEELEQVTMAVFSVRAAGFEAVSPENIGVVIEGNKILNGLTSVTSGCALLLGLIYILNLAYPKCLRYTFEVFQKFSWNWTFKR
ncbi:hypothetical protein WMY93_026700 [Mugilogobius chulae]|uniref:Uncharacterized protein n=1 Tax=Mugilogobius chulae TaxID=88201 RepID=A0AAW0MZV2_9GOBI